MDLQARPFRAFVTIAEAGSFRQASARLNISQPALSAQIREMERQLGFDLFDRTGRRVALTPEGSRFLDWARRLVLETDWVHQAARSIRTHELRIGAVHHSDRIAERCALVEGFIRANPQVPVRVLARSQAQLQQDLASNAIDFAITLEPVETVCLTSSLDRGAAVELQRHVIGTRPLTLLMPADGSNACGVATLAGIQVAKLSRAHGVLLSEAVAHWLSRQGAVLADFPEGDAPSLMRYAAMLRRPAVSLGWFGPPPQGLVEVPLANPLYTALVVLTRRGERRRTAERFLAGLPAPEPGG